jgi:hypothetical protein
MTSTDGNHDLVQTAIEKGYFNVPRETTLQALADEHGLTDVEASERLRAEVDDLLRKALDGTGDAGEEDIATEGVDGASAESSVD